MMRLALFVCTFGGVGYSPVAPGTAGSAAGLVVYAALRLTGASPVVEALVIALIIVAGVWSGTMAERHFGTTDPGPGVIDEVAGMDASGVNGVILTKLDGTAKGGIAVAIANDLKLPIRYVGVGEAIDDLIPFSPDEYVTALFEEKW